MKPVRHSLSGRFVILAVAASIAFGAGCARREIDRTRPKPTYEAFRAFVGNSDWESVFPLLIPEVKDNITKTWSMNRKTAMLIESSVPAALKQNFLSEIGPAEVRDAPTAQAYFAAIMRQAYPVALMPGDSRYSVETSIMKTKETRPGSRNYVITTTSGKTIDVVLGPDNTYGIVPQDDQSRMFRMNFKAASELYINVKTVVESLGQENRKAPR